MATTWGQIRLWAQKIAPTADLDVLDQVIQASYATILDAYPWKGLEKAGMIQTLGQYSYGTVSVVNGSTAVSGTGTAWQAGQSSMQVRIGADRQAYTFTYVSGTSGTLDRAYKGASASDADYSLFKSVYKLPEDLKTLLQVNNLSGNFPLKPYSQADLDLRYPSRQEFGEPTIYAMAQDSTDAPPLRQVEFYKIPEQAAGYSFLYTKIPPAFDPQQTGASPLPWVPERVITNGIRADLSGLSKDYEGMKAFEELFRSGIEEMKRVELHRAPNTMVAEAARYTGGRAR